MKHFITAILALGIGQSLIGEEWSQYLGPNGNGRIEGKITVEVQKREPKILWKAKIGKGCSSFSISQGKALTVGNSGDKDTLWCFDAETGDVVWKKTYEEKLAPKFYDGGPGATPTIDGDRVYNLSKSGRLSCHQLANGKELWAVDYEDDFDGNMPTWGFSASPVVYGDFLLCLPCSKAGAMVALDKMSGKIKWKTKDRARPGYAAPVLAKHKGNDIALVFHGRNLVGYDLSKKGEVFFTFPWRTSYDVNASNPQIKGDLIYLSSGYNMGYAVIDISGSEPKIVHRDRDLPMIFQNSFLLGDDIIGCFGDKKYPTELFRMDLATGKFAWRHKLPGTRGSTALVGETLVVLTETGDLIFGRVGEKSFEKTGQHKILGKLCWAPLAISEGKLFARTNQGEAVCVSLE